MHVYKVDHVQLAMPKGEEEKARLFYNGVLGIQEKPKASHLAKRGGVWFEEGEVKIHLGVEENFVPAKKAHPALLIKDLPKLVDELKQQDYRVVEDQPLEGYNRVYVDDPFGNRIELMEPNTN